LNREFLEGGGVKCPNPTEDEIKAVGEFDLRYFLPSWEKQVLFLIKLDAGIG